MNRLSGSSYVLIALMAVTLAFIGTTLQLQQFASKLLPLVVGGFVLFLASVQLWKEISTRGRAGKTLAGDKNSVGEETRVEGRRYLPSLLWLVGFLLAIYWAGFVVAIFLLLLLYMKLNGSRLVTAIITAAIFTAIVYALFELVFRTDLYPGLLFG